MVEAKNRVMHDYISRLTEKTGRVWNKKLITLPEDLHERMVSEADRTGIPMYQAYISACELWLKSRGVTDKLGGLDEVAGEEEQFLRSALNLFRNRKRHREYADAVAMIEGLFRLVYKK